MRNDEDRTQTCAPFSPLIRCHVRPRQRARPGKSRLKFYRPGSAFSGSVEFVHVHLCVRDIWQRKHESCCCGVRRALVLPCAHLCAVKFVTERGQRQCGWGASSWLVLFPSLRTLRIGAASGGRAAQSRSCGSIRTLCRTTVPRPKFTRTAGKRRPFIDCSSSRSEALSPLPQEIR